VAAWLQLAQQGSLHRAMRFVPPWRAALHSRLPCTRVFRLVCPLSRCLLAWCALHHFAVGFSNPAGAARTPAPLSPKVCHGGSQARCSFRVRRAVASSWAEAGGSDRLGYGHIDIAMTPVILGWLSLLAGLVSLYVGKTVSGLTLGFLSVVLAFLAQSFSSSARAWSRARAREPVVISKQELEDVEEDRHVTVHRSHEAMHEAMHLEHSILHGSASDQVSLHGEVDLESTRTRKRDLVKSWFKRHVWGSEGEGGTALALEAFPEVSSAVAVAEEAEKVEQEMELSEVPGMDKVNLVVSVETDPQMDEPESKEKGVQLLLAQSGGDILQAMAQDDWKVNPVDPAQGVHEMFLPPVNYNLGMGSVSIPAPRFIATIQDSDDVSGDLHERLVGNLVLQNGEGILTVELGFPISTKLSLSAAGSARARVGRCGDAVYLQAAVDIGLKLPQVPGLQKIMQIFVKTYANQSVKDCARALAGGADKLSASATVNEQSAVAVAVATAAVAAAEMDVVGMAAQAGQVLMSSGAEFTEIRSLLESTM